MTDAIFKSPFHCQIIKTDIYIYIYDLFPVFIMLEQICNNNELNKTTEITKRDFSDGNTLSFQFLLESAKWNKSLPLNPPHKAYSAF